VTYYGEPVTNVFHFVLAKSKNPRFRGTDSPNRAWTAFFDTPSAFQISITTKSQNIIFYYKLLKSKMD